MEYFLDIRQPNYIIRLADLYNFIKDNNITSAIIYLYNVQEPCWPQHKEIKFNNDIDVSDIELVFTIGHYIDISLIEKAFGKFRKITVKSYPYFWLARSVCELYQAQDSNKDPYIQSSYQFNKLYTLWVNRFRDNRRRLIDNLLDNLQHGKNKVLFLLLYKMNIY